MPARGRMDAVRLHRRMASFLGNVLLQPHLLQPRLRITAAERNELLVVTRFDDLAILHHMDDISLHRRRKSVCDDDSGTVFHKDSKPTKPFVLGPGIHEARRLIEDYELNFAAEGPPEGNAL